MIPDANGLYTARSPEELKQLLGMIGVAPSMQTTGTLLPTTASNVTAAASPLKLDGYNFAAPTRPAIAQNSGNYRMDPRGNFVGDLMLDAAAGYGDLTGQFSRGISRPLKVNTGRLIGRGGRRMAGKAASALGGLPGMGKLGPALGAAAPAIGAVGGALAVGDVLLGDESLGNKAMDTTAMTVGGILGSVGGPLGTAAGVGIGKMASDATQWLFGDKKTPEQRKMELALAQLNGGVI